MKFDGVFCCQTDPNTFNLCRSNNRHFVLSTGEQAPISWVAIWFQLCRGTVLSVANNGVTKEIILYSQHNYLGLHWFRSCCVNAYQGASPNQHVSIFWGHEWPWTNPLYTRVAWTKAFQISKENYSYWNGLRGFRWLQYCYPISCL